MGRGELGLSHRCGPTQGAEWLPVTGGRTARLPRPSAAWAQALYHVLASAEPVCLLLILRGHLRTKWGQAHGGSQPSEPPCPRISNGNSDWRGLGGLSWVRHRVSLQSSKSSFSFLPASGSSRRHPQPALPHETQCCPLSPLCPEGHMSTHENHFLP